MKVDAGNPLKKREEFAVSLRKKKKTEIINDRRRKRLVLEDLAQLEAQMKDLYRDCPLFQSD